MSTTYEIVFPICPTCGNRTKNFIAFFHTYSGGSHWHDNYPIPDGEGGVDYVNWTLERFLEFMGKNGEAWIEDEYGRHYDLATFLRDVLEYPNTIEKFKCPFCDALVTRRERRANGNDHCANKHCYPANLSIEVKDENKDV